MNTGKLAPILLLSVLVLLVAGGRLSAQDATLPPDSLDVIVREGSAAPVLVAINATLSDGCARVGEVTQTVDGESVTITIAQDRVGDPFTACTQALVPVTIVEALDLTGLEAGEYTINVGDLSASVELGADLLDAATCYASAEAEAAETDEADDAPLTRPVVNVAGGYCLRLPEEYATEQTGPMTVVIPIEAETETNEAPMMDVEEAAPLLVIESADVTVEDFAALDVDDDAETVELANANGVLLDSLEDFEGERFLYILTDLTEIVASDRSGDDALWDSVLGSLIVFDPYTVASNLSEGQATP